VFISPEGIIGKYRKTHLPQMGFDRFAERGDEAPQVFETKVGRVGILICYEQVFPELARILTLKGAEIIVAIQNILVDRHECIAAFLAPCRAYENRVFLILSSRVGVERGKKFLGQSLIVNFTGDKIIQASDNHEEIIYATFDISKLLADERKKDWFADRRPELFGDISKKIDLDREILSSN
jgi:predicted amidohydrolase